MKKIILILFIIFGFFPSNLFAYDEREIKGESVKAPFVEMLNLSDSKYLCLGFAMIAGTMGVFTLSKIDKERN